MISVCCAQLSLDAQTAKEERQGEALPSGSVRKHLSRANPLSLPVPTEPHMQLTLKLSMNLCNVTDAKIQFFQRHEFRDKNSLEVKIKIK